MRAQPHNIGISRQIVFVVVFIIIFITTGLSAIIGVSSFKNLSTITIDELERMSKILTSQLQEIQENTTKSIIGMDSNPLLADPLEQLTNHGPYYYSDSSLKGREIEESDMIYTLQAQLKIIQAFQPLQDLHQHTSISLYNLSPYNQVEDAKPILNLRIDANGIWVAQFRTKGRISDRNYYFVQHEIYQPPSSNFFDVSSVYQLNIGDFYQGVNFKPSTTNDFVEIIEDSNIDRPNNITEARSEIIVLNEIPTIRTWASLQVSVSNPATWEAENTAAMIVVMDQAINKERLQFFKQQLGSDIAIALGKKILVSSLPEGETLESLNPDQTINSSQQSFYYAGQSITSSISSAQELRAIALRPISVLAKLTQSLFYQMGLLALLATIVASFAIFWTIKRLVNTPLSHLIEGVEKVSSGDLTHKVQIRPKNELGRLAYAFNNMSEELGKKSEELQNTIEALKEMDQLKDAFLANTSHELKTPLNGIIGIAESMIDGATGKLSRQQVENLAMLVSSGKRLSSLVNDILDFSKMRHHDLQLQTTPVDVKSIADVVLTLSQPLTKQKDLKLTNKTSDELSAVEADENRLQQILHNLVGNSIKFTDSGEISISAREVDGVMEIVVADSGIGIRTDKFHAIFESFEHADASASLQYGGTGLGLAVTKTLVELHQGNIWVESELNKGSRFFFTLPLSSCKATTKSLDDSLTALKNETISAHVSPLPDKEPNEDTNKEPDEVPNDTPEELAAINDVNNGDLSEPLPASIIGGYSVLVVDDEPINIQVVNNHLSLHHYKVDEAGSGIEALQMIASGLNPDLILLDVMMPKMTGFEVCKQLRKQYSSTELPIILVTAKNQASDLIEGFSSGANDYLTKPFSKHELLARIELHIQLSKSSHELLEKDHKLQDYAYDLEASNIELKKYHTQLEDMVVKRTNKLEQAQKQLIESEKMASLGELVAGVAHEINTPVGIGVTAASHLVQETNNIQLKYINNEVSRDGFVDFLKNNLEAGELILSNLSRATELVQNFKQVAVDQSSEELREFNLHTYIKEVLATIHPRIRKTNHQIKIRGGESKIINSYPGAFYQIITNLIMNSLLHAFEDNSAGTIDIHIEQTEGKLILNYSDNGQGIAEENQLRVFTPFFTTRRGQGGTGLGLHIVYNLVTQKLKGSINCISSPGVGTTLTITLPI